MTPQSHRRADHNHQLANHLALISGLVRLQALDLGEKDVMTGSDIRLALEETIARIDAVTRLHRLLATSDDKTVDLGVYLQAILEGVAFSFRFIGKMAVRPPSAVGYHVGGDQALPVGLLVAELVTNGIKYAHPSGIAGVLSVTCSKRDDAIFVETIDDGVGLPEGLDPMTGGGLGLRLVRSLAQQIRGALVFDSGPLGLRVQLKLPTAILRIGEGV